MLSIRTRAVVLALALVVLTALPASASTPTALRRVRIADFFYQPQVVNLMFGDGVAWRNVGQAPHTVTATDGSFDSGTLQPGQTFRWRALVLGTINYYCSIHPSMIGQINVQ